ncbi:MAG: hypothetical protein CL583_17825 [Alteromonadaceae bacterium]|nr:hypothetical protein [Alteromonadaceae bacterium]|tara:strand:+ start:1557 stop:2195 length:639 start_codon:yes stop_codon:yes gene_type:complete
MIRRFFGPTTLSALLLLTACGDTQNETPLQLGLSQLQNIGKPAHQTLTAAQIRSRLTPDLLATLPDAVIVATLTKRKVSSVLLGAGRNGDTVTYLTPDGISMALREGMLVGTRGLGFDLMNADVEEPLAALAGGADTGVVRLHRYLDGENATELRSFVCDYARNGATINETCHTPGITINNSYEMTRQGQIAASRQWIGPEVGYVEIQQVRR